MVWLRYYNSIIGFTFEKISAARNGASKKVVFRHWNSIFITNSCVYIYRGLTTLLQFHNRIYVWKNQRCFRENQHWIRATKSDVHQRLLFEFWTALIQRKSELISCETAVQRWFALGLQPGVSFGAETNPPCFCSKIHTCTTVSGNVSQHRIFIAPTLRNEVHNSELN